ncbi:MAG: Rieske 2Fe-2S domain-containing protein [Myxococcota bacterium]
MSRPQALQAMPAEMPLPANPTGWYVIAMSDELRPGRVLARRNFGRELALFRTRDGRARVVDAYCPHMGAHLGHQGRVDGDDFVCTFHGLRYDGTGRCHATPTGDPPPLARLREHAIREQSGMILIWFDEHDRAPDWSVPALEPAGFTQIAWRRFQFRGHPQETTENSVDFGHFLHVHGFPAASNAEAIRTEGPVLRAHYAIRRAFLKSLPRLALDVDFDVVVHGLGYSLVEAEAPQFGARIRLFVLPIPREAGRVDLVLGSAIAHPVKLFARAFNAFAIRGLCSEVAQDIEVWEHKAHLPNPKLLKSEGAVAVYRRWCRQFDPERAA